jgi:hypothetical protein
MAMVRIADLVEGTEVTVRGTIVPGADQVTSRGGVECVFWEVVGADHGGAPFWIEDESGRALIDPADASVTARTEYREQLINLATAELADIEERIRRIKHALKEIGGPAASKLGAELKPLRKLATLLCAIRAKANGNVHVGGTLDGQDRYIRERSPRFADLGSQTLALSQAAEIALTAGDRIEVSGLVTREPIPPDLFAGGYRDKPTCLRLRPPAGGELRIRGLGDAAPAPVALTVSEAPPSPARRFDRAMLVGLIFLIITVFGIVELLVP